MFVRPGVRGVLFLLHCLGNAASLARLVYRMRTRRLWWDDFWAFVAMLSDLLFLGLFGTQVNTSNQHSSEAHQILTILAGTSTLWGSKLSIAVAIVRLVPPGYGRRAAKGAAVLFSLIWCGLLVEKLYACQRQFSTGVTSHCLLPTQTGILEICTDIVGDVWLICSPAYLLWNMKLSNRRQIVIFSVFASDLLVAVASVVHGVYIVQQKASAIRISAIVEVGISLIICNLLVLVTWLYSRIYPSDQEQDVTTSVNYPTTIPTSRRPRHPDAPIYGFEGSVLVLTQISSPSVSIVSTISDSQSTYSTFGRLVSKPRAHSLSTPYPILSIPSEALPTYLRSTKSCPPLFFSTPMIRPKLSGGMNIRWDNVPFEARVLKRSSSLTLSLDLEGWDQTDARTYGTGTIPRQSIPPYRQITEYH